MSTVHVLPVNDLIEHADMGDECVCGPTSEPVERDDGSYGWVIVHHSLDGREYDGPDDQEVSEMGGKPNPGTKKDRRLKQNKSKKKGKK